MRGNAMNLLEVGALLKRERERCGISIRDVMDATKISRRNLTALEEGQLKSLPHPVYLKGYVRNIAKMVGLDAAELSQVVDEQYDQELAKYLPQAPAVAPAAAPSAILIGSAPAADREPATPQPERQTEPQPEPQPERQTEAAPQRPAPDPDREVKRFIPEPLAAPKPKSSGALRSVVVLVLLAAVLIWLLVQFKSRPAEAPTPPAPVAQPAVSAANATAQDNVSAALDNATAEPTQPEPGSAAAPAVAPAPEHTAPVTPAQATQTPGQQSVPATSIEVTRKAPAPVPAPVASQVSTPAAEKQAQATTPGMQRLTIQAKADEVCWVQVSDGQQVKSFTLRNGETHQVEFSKRMRVRLGNAGGVTFRVNGQDYPYEGKRGSIDTVEFGGR